MKAIDLLREFNKDSYLAEYGTIVDMSADAFVECWFGQDARHVSGKIEIEDGSTPYFAIYKSASDKIFGFISKYLADAVVDTPEDTIYLWRIEE